MHNVRLVIRIGLSSGLTNHGKGKSAIAEVICNYNSMTVVIGVELNDGLSSMGQNHGQGTVDQTVL